MTTLGLLFICFFQVETPQEIMALPQDLIEQLDAQIIRAMPDHEKFEIILKMLSPHDPNQAIAYAGPGTQTVAETWRNKRANCLSMTFLIVAMARHVGLESRFHNYLDLDLYTEKDDEVLYNLHMVAYIRLGNTWLRRDFARSTAVPASAVFQAVIDEIAIAQFYNNKAAEAIGKKRWTLAHAYLQAAIEMDPQYIASWRNLGVFFTRTNKFEEAQNAYLTALSLDKNDELTWFNLAILFERWGKGEERFYAQKKWRRCGQITHFFKTEKLGRRFTRATLSLLKNTRAGPFD